jgi:hypothetical protein
MAPLLLNRLHRPSVPAGLETALRIRVRLVVEQEATCTPAIPALEVGPLEGEQRFKIRFRMHEPSITLP